MCSLCILFWLLRLVLSVVVQLVASEYPISEMTCDGSSGVLNPIHLFTEIVIFLYHVYNDSGEYFFRKMISCISSAQ